MAKKKQVRRTRYVMLVEKKNGRISKNEQYPVNKFMELVFTSDTTAKRSITIRNPPSKWKYMRLNVKKFWKDLSTFVNQSVDLIVKDTIEFERNTVLNNIHRLIDEDEKGRKKK